MLHLIMPLKRVMFFHCLVLDSVVRCACMARPEPCRGASEWRGVNQVRTLEMQSKLRAVAAFLGFLMPAIGVCQTPDLGSTTGQLAAIDQDVLTLHKCPVCPLLADVCFCFGTTPFTAVRVHQTDLGRMFVDENGRTLYVSSEDPVGKSVCHNDCLTEWTPLCVDSAETSGGQGVSPAPPFPATLNALGFAVGETGGLFCGTILDKGMPLYSSKRDQRPGDTRGDGVDGRRVARP
jgi:predicted lipoprotein with Yx(FWY)xxD motif